MMTVRKAWQDYRDIEHSFDQLSGWLNSGKVTPDERELTGEERFNLYRLLTEIQKDTQTFMFNLAVDLLPDVTPEVQR